MKQRTSVRYVCMNRLPGGARLSVRATQKQASNHLLKLSRMAWTGLTRLHTQKGHDTCNIYSTELRGEVSMNIV